MVRRVECADCILHLIRETSHLPVRQETMCVYGSFDSQFVHLIKNIDRRLLIRVEDTSYVTIEYLLTNLLSLLFSSFFCPIVSYCFTSAVSSTRSKSPIVARMCWQKQT